MPLHVFCRMALKKLYLWEYKYRSQDFIIGSKTSTPIPKQLWSTSKIFA